MQEPDVVLKSVPAQQFLALLALHEVLPDMSAVRRLVERKPAVVPAVVRQNGLDYITIVIHFPIYDPEALDFEKGTCKEYLSRFRSKVQNRVIPQFFIDMYVDVYVENKQPTRRRLRNYLSL